MFSARALHVQVMHYAAVCGTHNAGNFTADAAACRCPRSRHQACPTPSRQCNAAHVHTTQGASPAGAHFQCFSSSSHAREHRPGLVDHLLHPSPTLPHPAEHRCIALVAAAPRGRRSACQQARALCILLLPPAECACGTVGKLVNE